MKMAWDSGTDRILCRWSEAGERAQYKPSWIVDTSESSARVPSPVPDFTRLSPFGGKDWFATSSLREPREAADPS